MSVRRPTESAAEAVTSPAAGTPARPPSDRAPAPATPQPDPRPRSREEAEARYVTARDAWTAAMRKANSGQEMAWRRVHEEKVKQPGALSRLARRLARRG